MSSRFLIGTRKSAMAMAQTEFAAAALRKSAGVDVGVAAFSPVGDRDQVSRLHRHGGKGGAFVSEIRTAIAQGAIQAAMHSLKDMPGDEEAPGLVIGAYLKREDPADALVLRPGVTQSALFDAGRKIGTNSIRRAALARRLFPHAEIIHYRGAADTRLRKLDDGAKQKLAEGGEVGPADALIMAAAGLVRIEQGARIERRFSFADMLPAIGQGIVALECRRDDWTTRALLAQIDDAPTRAAAEAEREALWILNGHCNAPIAGLAQWDGPELTLHVMVLSHDGLDQHEATVSGPGDRPKELGRRAALDLLARGAGAMIDAARLAP